MRRSGPFDKVSQDCGERKHRNTLCYYTRVVIHYMDVSEAGFGVGFVITPPNRRMSAMLARHHSKRFSDLEC